MSAPDASTWSVCPECLERIAARRVLREGSLYLEKTCPRHGDFSTVIWRDADTLAIWQDNRPAQFPENCPSGCTTCSGHGQKPCCVLLEVTRRCDLSCSFCFASSGPAAGPDPDLRTIDGWYSRLLDAGGPFNIQLSGGEPCMRDDLETIVALGRRRGFPFIQVNTNGLRIAGDPGYLKRLADAGLSTVYLQFDATDDAAYERLRGRKLFSLKQRAVENCAKQNIGVVLVATVVPGINDHELGSILRAGLACSPVVRGVHFQPVSYFGRYPQQPAHENRMTLPDCMRCVVDQSGGLLELSALSPASSEHAMCSFHGTFVYMADGRLQALPHSPQPCACNAAEKARDFVARAWAYPQAESSTPQLSLGGWDAFLERARTHLFTVSGMAFQDAWTLDLERLHRCHIFIVSPEGHMVPFCAYNLTSRAGESLYRGRTRKSP